MGDNISMMNANYAVALADKRKELKGALENVKALRAEVRDLAAKAKEARFAAKVNRCLRQVEKREIAARRAAERIAKAEARVEALKAREAARAQKAARKAGKVVDVTERFA